MNPYLSIAGKMLFTIIATPIAITKYVVGKCFSRRRTQNWLDTSVLSSYSTPHPVEHRCYNSPAPGGLFTLAIGPYVLFSTLAGGSPNLLLGLICSALY